MGRLRTPANRNNILLFDGFCYLCSGNVRFLIKRDPSQKFRFAALQSEAGKRICQTLSPAPPTDSFVLVDGAKYFVKSTAVLKVLARLSGLWPLLYVLMLVPRPLRDALYDWVAKNRYRWFGKKQLCESPSPEFKERFLSED